MSLLEGDDFETKLHNEIVKHKQLYYNINATDQDFDNIIDEAFESLERIKKLMDDFYKIGTEPLLSKIHIMNRKKIREENDQYRLEIKYETQCLKKKILCKYRIIWVNYICYSIKFLINILSL